MFKDELNKTLLLAAGRVGRLVDVRKKWDKWPGQVNNSKKARKKRRG
jgi:hypothetical protein